MAVEKSGGGGASSSSSSPAASAADRFLKIVLSWDYLRLVADSKVTLPSAAPAAAQLRP
jgi:senataxin